MIKKKKVKVEESQGEIIDEIRKARAQVGREFRENSKLFLEKAQQHAKELGMRYANPSKNKKKEDDAA